MGVRGWRDLAPAFGLGVLAASGQAPLGAWYLAVPAFAGIVWQVTAGRPAARGWAAGTGYFAAALSWIVQPFFVEPETYGWMAPFALVLMAGGLALFWGAAAGLAARLVRTTARQALAFALCLSGAEALRGVVFTGFPWAQPGHIWIDTPVAQLAALTGADGLTLLTLVLAALPVMARGRGTLAAALLLAMVWGGGVWQLAQPDPAAPGLTFRLVQPAAEQSLKWDPAQAERLYRLQTGYTAAEPRPDLVIWPETALPYLYTPGGDAALGVAEAARGVPVALGVQRVEGAAAYNSLAVLGPDGYQTAIYDKAHLVPFGEYLPFGDLAWRLFGISAFAARQGYGYAAGPGPRVLDLGPLGKAMPLICYEAVFPEEVNAAPERPGWLLQITNDAWFGTLTGPFQHAAQARLRAVEQGLPLVRVANTGVTQMVDARGRVTAELPFGRPGYLDAALPGALPPTPYSRYGMMPFLLLLGGLALTLARRRAHPSA
ncbi:Apolipoprotein N-acyltransferase [Gemmobacter caeni]|uniref:Apolipoprotein N-acyltransferase n=1 Tax=Gemmobacter caeni TaxID=589035 RepID=A0A2T6ASG0_9RHOB|nr:apolipoprotein N-acyltransferase [Gemmobacter caeni]PTX46764.1 apolipoprotein N-acyltransferase [Gemmobacter caeni]TWI95762.1 Apolipoprotein N-acyltransferase [Gemmobacter caeni]